MSIAITKKFLYSIYRSAPTHFGAIDLCNKELIFSSGLAEKLLGYTGEEVNRYAKDDFKEIIHPDDLPKQERLFEQLQKSEDGEVVRSILRVKSHDGSYLHFQVNDMVYERRGDGTPTKYSTVIEDVTEEAKAKEKLAEACKIIREIKHKNSHELRAPVANMISIVNLMKEEHFHNDYQRELIHYLGVTVEKLDEIIHQINEETQRK